MTTQMPKTTEGMLALTKEQLEELKPTDFPQNFDLRKVVAELMAAQKSGKYPQGGAVVAALIREQPQKEYAFVLAYREIMETLF